MYNKPLPHEELLKICKKAAGDSVWAMEMSATEEGKLVWCVYCDDEHKIKKLPKVFKGQPVSAIFCKKPNFTK